MSKLLVEIGIAWEDMTWSIVDVELEWAQYSDGSIAQAAIGKVKQLMKPDIKDKIEHCWLYSYREEE